MLELTFSGGESRKLKLLCLGAHSDDIEIGCGGTILRLAARYPQCELYWAVFSAIGLREAEAQRGASLFSASTWSRRFIGKSFRDGFMPYMGAEVKNAFEELKDLVSPDIIFTHNRRDAHQDHRLISELTGNTFRNHLVLEYEIPKYDGDMGQPNVFVPLPREIGEQKVSCILDIFQSQRSKHWFQKDTFFSLMRLRGMECNAPSGLAEAFYCHKLVLL